MVHGCIEPTVHVPNEYLKNPDPTGEYVYVTLTLGCVSCHVCSTYNYYHKTIN